MTAAPRDHVHISEREADGSWEDCTWDSGLEWFRLCHDARKPATHAEAQALRKASGEPPTGGSNIGDLRRGFAKRYGVTVQEAESARNWKSRRKEGRAFALQGSMSAFGRDHRLSKYDRSFDGAHAVLLIDMGDVLLWCDPEAPTGAAVPVVVSVAEVDAFVKAFNGQMLVGTIRNTQQQETTTVANLTSYLPGYTALIRDKSNVRAEPRIAGKLLHTTTSDTPTVIVGTVEGDTDPANGSTVWYELFHEGRSEYTAKDNIKNLKAPKPVGVPDYPDLRTEVTRLNTLTATQSAALDAAAKKAAKYDAIKAALS